MVKIYHKIGVPAVIASRTEILDSDVKIFSIAIYESLIAGDTLKSVFNKAQAILESKNKEGRFLRSLNWEGNK